jgi:hypothetical protein
MGAKFTSIIDGVEATENLDKDVPPSLANFRVKLLSLGAVQGRGLSRILVETVAGPYDIMDPSHANLLEMPIDKLPIKCTDPPQFTLYFKGSASTLLSCLVLISKHCTSLYLSPFPCNRILSTSIHTQSSFVWKSVHSSIDKIFANKP